MALKMKKQITEKDLIENEYEDKIIGDLKREIMLKKSNINNLKGEIDMIQMEINYLLKKRKERQYEMRI